MRKKEEALQGILSQQLLPLYYHEDEYVSLAVLQALYEGGMRVVEYTARGDNALRNFIFLRERINEKMPGLQLGIGTIKKGEQARQYLNAGADFMVCPTTNTEVGNIIQEAGLLWIPGALTPTEIGKAENAGASLVKIFPGNLLGPSYISSIKEIFPHVKFMPTGGVEAEENNLRNWFRAGVAAVGMGSKLITKQMIEEKDYKGLKTATVGALHLVKQVMLL